MTGANELPLAIPLAIPDAGTIILDTLIFTLDPDDVNPILRRNGEEEISLRYLENNGEESITRCILEMDRLVLWEHEYDENWIRDSYNVNR